MALIQKDNLLDTTLSTVTFLDPAVQANVDQMESEVTIIINTLCRPYHLQNLLDSIRQFYPNIAIIVADESKCAMDTSNFPLGVDYHWIGFNKGNSAARNHAMTQVKTPYVVVMEDVHEVTADTNLLAMYSVLNDLAGAPYALIAGDIIGKDHSEGDFSRSVDDDLIITGFDHAMHAAAPNGYILEADVVHDFFMARTIDVRQVDWHEDLPHNEHWTFFFKWKCCEKLALYYSVPEVIYGAPMKPVCPPTNCSATVIPCECKCDADAVRNGRHSQQKALEINHVKSITFSNGHKVENKNWNNGCGSSDCHDCN